ncbi:DUF4829 domain-containing protein, partial [Streptomyces sp. UNOB3_S3]|nr:DUF4829 domain-containing protein [Streptomyces sp. UNOB3_S3]
PSTPPPPMSGPGQVVEDYYAAINAHDYRRAWSLGGRNLDGSYDSYAAGFAQTASVALTVTSVSGDTVTMRLDTRQTDGSQRHFAGTYTVRNGEIVSADVRGG